MQAIHILTNKIFMINFFFGSISNLKIMATKLNLDHLGVFRSIISVVFQNAFCSKIYLRINTSKQYKNTKKY
jgi:cytochrome c biogenesis factor